MPTKLSGCIDPVSLGMFPVFLNLCSVIYGVI